MIRAHLGETIDIHGGGLDLIFPHHENEIAQSRCAHGGKPLARYWVHNGFVDMGSEKMSKSLGNIVTPAELLEKHRGETLRLALLSAHYRQPLAWTEEVIAQAKATLDRLYRVVGNSAPGEPDLAVIAALSDDLNTPLAMARLSAIEDPATLKASAALLGLLEGTADQWFQGGGDAAEIEARIAQRADAKENRDFAAADRIRDELRPRASCWKTVRPARRGARNERAALHDRNPAAGGNAARAAASSSGSMDRRSNARRPAAAR